jgi:Xaa-Pro dipeptidase
MNSSQPFVRAPLPERFCQLERLLHGMEARGLDGIVATTPCNVFYLSGFNGIAHKSDEPKPYAVVLSRHAPDHPVLLLADYYVSTLLSQPSWIKDVRSFRSVMLPLDLAARDDDLDRFLTHAGAGADWVQQTRKQFSNTIHLACRDALEGLGLAGHRVGFDDLRFGYQLAMDGLEVADAYDSIMYARCVKTAFEIGKLKEATRINQSAIERTVSQWQRGMSWRALNHAYHRAAIDLGGFVRDPGAMVWAHPRGSDTAVTLQTGLEDFELTPGLNVMFDCHGTRDMYCWDGGKTWVVDGEPEGDAKRNADAVARASEAVLAAMRPGARISELQATGRAALRKARVPDADSALIFFHGLGLSHMDLEQTSADGTPNHDWRLEKDMVVPLHILYPGNERHRVWVEEIARVDYDGGEPFFTWGFDPMTGVGR